MIKHKFPGLRITEKDISLFALLFEYKVATVKQIREHCYPGKSLKNCYKRINKLIGMDLVESFWHTKNGLPHKVCHLTEMGRNLVSPIYSEYGKNHKIKSEYPGHDLALLDIGKAISSIGNVKNYIPENLLQSHCDFQCDGKFKDFVNFHSDAYFQLDINGEAFDVALEYEHTAKSSARYEKLVSNYYLSEQVDIIFYIYKDPSVRRMIGQIEEAVWTKNPSKIFFQDVDAFKKCKDLGCFENRLGQVLDFN